MLSYNEIRADFDSHLEAFLAWMIRGGIKTTTAEQYVGIIRAMMRQTDIRNQSKFEVLIESYKSSTRNLRLTARRKYLAWLADELPEKGKHNSNIDRTVRITHTRILASLKQKIDKIHTDYEMLLRNQFVTQDFLEFVNEVLLEKDLRELRSGGVTQQETVPFIEDDNIDPLEKPIENEDIDSELEPELELESESEPEPESEPKAQNKELDDILEELINLSKV